MPILHAWEFDRIALSICWLTSYKNLHPAGSLHNATIMNCYSKKLETSAMLRIKGFQVSVFAQHIGVCSV
jgi:hypothetical protein